MRNMPQGTASRSPSSALPTALRCLRTAVASPRYSCPHGPAGQQQGVAFPPRLQEGLGTLPPQAGKGAGVRGWGVWELGGLELPIPASRVGATPAPTPRSSSRARSFFPGCMGIGGGGLSPALPGPEPSSPSSSHPLSAHPSTIPTLLLQRGLPSLPAHSPLQAQEFSHHPLAEGMSSPHPIPNHPAAELPSRAGSPLPQPCRDPPAPRAPPSPPGMPFPSAGRSRTLYSPPACCCSSESGDRL